MDTENIISELEQSRRFLSFSTNSNQLSSGDLEDLNSLLSQALEQAREDDQGGLLASLTEMEKLQPTQFNLTTGVRELL